MPHNMCGSHMRMHAMSHPQPAGLCSAMAGKLAALNELLVALRGMVPPRALQLMRLSGVSQSLHQQSWGMLGVPIIGITVLAEGEDDGVNGDVIHLHIPPHSTPRLLFIFQALSIQYLTLVICLSQNM